MCHGVSTFYNGCVCLHSMIGVYVCHGVSTFYKWCVCVMLCVSRCMCFTVCEFHSVCVSRCVCILGSALAIVFVIDVFKVLHVSATQLLYFRTGYFLRNLYSVYQP